ncbi:hypothetical protein [Bordetella sp. 2513F-2]
MPAWIPILKASLPYLTQIVTTALPVFTRPAKADDVIGKQIAELQTAVTQNAESLHVMASKLQETIQGIDMAAQSLQAQMAGLKRLAGAAMVVALLALGVAVWAVAR